MKGGPDSPVSQWVEVIEAAHRAGLTSTSTMVFGHVETPAHQVAHLRLLAGIQDRTGGFTEFIAMPFVPAAAAVTAPGLVGTKVPGPSWRQVAGSARRGPADAARAHRQYPGGLAEVRP